MMRRLSLTLLLAALCAPLLSGQEPEGTRESVVLRLVEAGFANVRSAETDGYVVYAIENDAYKLPAEGFARACRIIEGAGLPEGKQVKIVGLNYDVPEVTIIYEPDSGSWHTTRRLDESWDLVRSAEKRGSSFGKVDVVIYPQLSLKNLIINQVYQSLWQLSPAVEVSLWPGMKFSYQLKFPIFSDGYGDEERIVHPGMITLSQRFRDPWHLNVNGRLSVGSFAGNRYGLALEMAYWFPNERFSLDTQLGLLGSYYWNGFRFCYSRQLDFRWNLAGNYYCPPLGTQFTLRIQQFLLGEIGVKYEMIRHMQHCSVGLYAEKAQGAQLNVGFRFQVALPPYRQKRRGYIPRVVTSGQMGMTYNSNNEQYYYKEFRTEASDNIMSRNYFNPYYIDAQLNLVR